MKHVTKAKAVVVKDTPDYYGVQIEDLLFTPGALFIKNSTEPGKVVVSFTCDADKEISELLKANLND